MRLSIGDNLVFSKPSRRHVIRDIPDDITFIPSGAFKYCSDIMVFQSIGLMPGFVGSIYTTVGCVVRCHVGVGVYDSSDSKFIDHNVGDRHDKFSGDLAFVAERLGVGSVKLVEVVNFLYVRYCNTFI